MIISKIHQTKIKILFNALSLTATFTRGLHCLGNGLLNVRQPTDVSATISETPCPQPNVLVNNAG